MRFLALLLLLFGLNAQATTPTVSNVTGYTGTPGETLTITGTTMQDEVISTLLSSWANNSNGAFYMTVTCCAPGTPSAPIYGAAYATDFSVVNNSNSYKLNWSGASPGNLVAEWYLNTNYNRTTGSKWRGGYIRTDTTGSWPSGYLKLFSEYGSAQGGCFFELTGGVNFQIMCTNYNFGSGTGSFHTVTIPGGWVDQQWNLVEVKFPCGGTDTLEIYYNNGQVFSQSVTGGGTCNSSGAYPSMLTNASGTSSGFDQDWWFDGFYESSDRIGPLSLIEITSGSNYAATSYAAGTRVYQIPISITNTLTTVKLETLPSGGGPYYLWVTNQQGERSSGYLLGGAPPTAATYLPIKL